MADNNALLPDGSPPVPATTDGTAPSPGYRALDQTRKEFRVLVVEPGLPEQPVRCTFTTASLSDSAIPAYETVSYVWGDTGLRGIVSVDGHDLDVPLTARKVLERMRDPDRPRTVWIDAVCIDQRNLRDRNYLVQLMCEIYSHTTVGFVWLGEDDCDVRRTFGAIRGLYEEARRETEGFETFKETVWPGWWQVYGSPTSVQFEPESMARLFSNSWFSRLWCVQEAALAPRSICHCGAHSIPLLHLLRAAIWLYSKNKTLPEPLSGMSGLARAVHIASYTDELLESPFQKGSNLLWMMNTLRQYDASLDKDHIYGLIGMYQRFTSNYDLPPSLAPRYDRSAQDIYSDATKLAMAELERADPLLYICHHSTEEVENNWLPTWIPQWQRKQDLTIDTWPLNYSGFTASGATKVRIDLAAREALGTLTLDGFVLGRVKAFTAAFTSDVLRSGGEYLRLSACAEALVAGVGAEAGELAQTLVASLSQQRTPMGRGQCVAGYRALRQVLLKQEQLPEPAHKSDEDIDSETIATSRTYREALDRWLRNRCVFVTQAGHVGAGPKVMREDDLITILCGSRVPIILRRRGQTDAYVVVGPAYVNGVMLGEAFEAHRAREGEDVRFDTV
ncbi:hypothetical protein LTR53_012190 [Teratosphaeriaceae sp. CCFEE 6253]|nr:hypothetical protein LTR53_012190 [Teratosphaeriaceae sp. CCFEE 6253]